MVASIWWEEIERTDCNFNKLAFHDILACAMYDGCMCVSKRY